MKCELCGRDNPTNFHHLMPRKLHSRKWFKKTYSREELNMGIDICKYECHPFIHATVNELELGKYYNTKELLLSRPEIKSYVEWIQGRK